jgi:hypothetical protein
VLCALGIFFNYNYKLAFIGTHDTLAMENTRTHSVSQKRGADIIKHSPLKDGENLLTACFIGE